MSEPTDMKNDSGMEFGETRTDSGHAGTETASGAERSKKTAAEAGPDGAYSWVSPRIRQAGTESGPDVNPWGSDRKDADSSFWTEQVQRDRRESSSRAPQPGFSQYRTQPEQAAQRDKSRLNLAEQKKKPSAGRRWSALIAMALVFGLIAGTVGYGVILAGYRICPPAPQQTISEAGSSGQDSSGTRLAQTETAQDAAGTENSGSEDIAGTEDSGSEAAAGTEDSGSEAAAGTKDTGSEAAAGTMDSGPEEMSVADVTENSMPAMVTISTMSVMEMQSFFGGSQKYTAKGAGTGIIVGQNDSELLIATNNHVVEGASQLSVGFIDEEAAEAVIKGTDSDADLAVIAVKLEDIPEETKDRIRIATIGDSDALRLGEQIVVIGNALGYGQSVTSGYVSAFDRELNLSDGTNSFISSNLIQVDAAINSGNSGGALLNMRGELVGINEAKSSVTMSGATVDNVGYAIPINKAEPILEELMNETTRERYSEEEQGYLGVTCANVTAEYARMYGMPEGVCFTTVVEGGPAEEAGILKGDVLISFDGKAIKTYEALTDRLTYYKAGDAVTVVVLRANGGGEYTEHTLTVTLGDRDILEKVIGSTPEEG